MYVIRIEFLFRIKIIQIEKSHGLDTLSHSWNFSIHFKVFPISIIELKVINCIYYIGSQHHFFYRDTNRAMMNEVTCERF